MVMGNVGVPSNQPLGVRLSEELFMKIGDGAASVTGKTKKRKPKSNMSNQ
jgi:hypothetical protein